MNSIYLSQCTEIGSVNFGKPEIKPMILVVEDDPGVQMVIVKMAKRAGLQVITATNGAEALARFIESPTPLVITDLHMPQMDGLELLREIKSSHPETFVILASANPTMVKLEEQPDYLLRKPFRIQEFDEAVQAFYFYQAQIQ
jgi:CheY-like chemotaxis protein